MASIGLLSIFDMTNVGNRLQQYALVKALETMRHDPVVIPNTPYPAPSDDHETAPVGDLRASTATADMPNDDDRSQGAAHEPPAEAGNETLLSEVTSKAAPSIPGEAAPIRDFAAAGSSEAPKRRNRQRNIKLPAPLGKVAGRLQGLSVNKVERMAGKLVRIQALWRFTKNNMVLSDQGIHAPGDGEKLADRFDKFITGSDQVWNPNYRGACPTDFLQFAPRDKRIAYAASFGVESLAGPRRRVIARMAAEIPHVSIRERAGAELFHELTGRNVPVVVDPTLLLDPTDWSRFADRGTRASKQPYVATYLLTRYDEVLRKQVETAAKRQGLRVVDILAPRTLMRSAYTPETTLRMIRDAECVVTDSFHMTLFSVLFRRPLVPLSKSESNDRLLTLFATLGVELELAREMPDRLPMEAPPSRIDELLPAARERGLAFLRSALGE